MVGLASLLLATWPGEAHAYPVHRRLFKRAFGEPTGCQLCHGYGGGTERNPYGEAWHEAGESEAAFRTIARGDSDGDGASNGDEIEAGSNPGDPASTPGAPGEQWRRSVNEIFVPLEQLELVFEDMGRVEAAEVDLTDAQVAAVEAAIGGRLSLEDRLPTLYFDVHDGRREAVAVFHQLRRREGTYSLLTAVARDGTAQRIIVFRDPEEEAYLFHPYLRCLEGAPRDALPEPGEGACQIAQGREEAQRAMGAEIRKVLEVVAAHVAGAASAGEPAAAPTAARDAGAAPTEDAPVEGPTVGGELDFEAVPTTVAVEVLPVPVATVLALLLLAAYLGLVHLSSQWIVRREARADTPWPRLSTMAPGTRMAIAVVTLGLMLAQLVAVMDAYVQTQVVHDSAYAYFAHLSEARLLGTSHSHLFGYTVLYGVLALLVGLTSATPRLRATVASALLWVGPFDVLSWWGQKLGSPRFDWLTMACGAAAGTASLVAAFLVVRSALRDEPAPPPPAKGEDGSAA